jgi:hypothetical protein
MNMIDQSQKRESSDERNCIALREEARAIQRARDMKRGRFEFESGMNDCHSSLFGNYNLILVNYNYGK